MKAVIFSIVIGYLLGSINPAALLSAIKKTDLRDNGTGNLGATNTMLVLGKSYGVLVMVFDMAKAVVSVKLAQKLFPLAAMAGIVAGGSCVVGHIFPFYLHFKGGKGLASFGGMILAVDPFLFIILLSIALTLMFVLNYSVAMPVSAAILFPILYGIRAGSAALFFLAAAVSVLIIYVHRSNILKVKNGEEEKIREYVKEHLFH